MLNRLKNYFTEQLGVTSKFDGYEIGPTFGANARRFAIYDDHDMIVKTYARRRDAVRGLERLKAAAIG